MSSLLPSGIPFLNAALHNPLPRYSALPLVLPLPALLSPPLQSVNRGMIPQPREFWETVFELEFLVCISTSALVPIFKTLESNFFNFLEAGCLRQNTSSVALGVAVVGIIGIQSDAFNLDMLFPLLSYRPRATLYMSSTASEAPPVPVPLPKTPLKPSIFGKIKPSA